MYNYLKSMYNIFQKYTEHVNMLKLHQETSKTQQNDNSAQEVAKSSANSPENGDGANKMSPAGRGTS